MPSDQPLNWLLEKNNPSVRYFTLRDLLHYPEEHPELTAEKIRVMESAPVQKILQSQNLDGYWGNSADFYTRSKYRGTVWNFILLAELGADGSHPAIRNAARFILEQVQEPLRGGFVYRHNRYSNPDPNCALMCLTGNMVYALIQFGWLDDPGVEKAIRWLSDYLRFDDGNQPPPQGFPYLHLNNCYGRHTCMTGVVKGLKALTAIPAGRRDEHVNSTIQSAVEFLLIHKKFMRSHQPDQVGIPGWINPGFPNMWDTDILEVAKILHCIGCQDNRIQPALELIRSKKSPENRWHLERSWNGRMLVKIEKRDQPSKWITLRAMEVLQDQLPLMIT